MTWIKTTRLLLGTAVVLLAGCANCQICSDFYGPNRNDAIADLTAFAEGVFNADGEEECLYGFYLELQQTELWSNNPDIDRIELRSPQLGSISKDYVRGELAYLYELPSSNPCTTEFTFHAVFIDDDGACFQGQTGTYTMQDGILTPPVPIVTPVIFTELITEIVDITDPPQVGTDRPDGPTGPPPPAETPEEPDPGTIFDGDLAFNFFGTRIYYEGFEEDGITPLCFLRLEAQINPTWLLEVGEVNSIYVVTEFGLEFELDIIQFTDDLKGFFEVPSPCQEVPFWYEAIFSSLDQVVGESGIYCSVTAQPGDCSCNELTLLSVGDMELYMGVYEDPRCFARSSTGCSAYGVEGCRFCIKPLGDPASGLIDCPQGV